MNFSLRWIEREPPDLVLLDIMMPLMNGFEVCRRIRKWSVVPIIMVTAKGDERDKVKCLDMGADDYISKPFGINELMARIRAVLRRSQASMHIVNESSFACNGLTVNYAARTVKVDNTEIRLTPTEYNLLKELTLNAGKVLTYTHLLNRVWGKEYNAEREYLHVFIGRLRTKLGSKQDDSGYIMTIPGVGYQMKNAD